MKHLQKFGYIAIGSILTLAVMGTALAATGALTIEVNPINVQVNGQTFQPKDAAGKTVPVFAYNGTTYAPLRALAEAYGLKVGYDAATNMATVGETTPTKTPDKPTADYSTWTAEEEKAYQEWKALWKVESSETGGHQDYVNLSCGKENKEKVKNICAINDNSIIQKMNARIDVELYKTYNAGPSFYILYKIDENADGNIKTGWTDICYKDLKVSNGYSKSMILKELS